MKPSVKEKLLGSPVRSSEDVSQRVYLYEGLLGEKQTGKASQTGRKQASAREEGGTGQVAAWLLADVSADVRGRFYI